MSCSKVSAKCEVQVLESNILWKPGEHVIQQCYLFDHNENIQDKVEDSITAFSSNLPSIQFLSSSRDTKIKMV